MRTLAATTNKTHNASGFEPALEGGSTHLFKPYVGRSQHGNSAPNTNLCTVYGMSLGFECHCSEAT